MSAKLTFGRLLIAYLIVGFCATAVTYYTFWSLYPKWFSVLGSDYVHVADVAPRAMYPWEIAIAHGVGRSVPAALWAAAVAAAAKGRVRSAHVFLIGLVLPPAAEMFIGLVWPRTLRDSYADVLAVLLARMDDPARGELAVCAVLSQLIPAVMTGIVMSVGVVRSMRRGATVMEMDDEARAGGAR